jgi:hypothetical protein
LELPTPGTTAENVALDASDRASVTKAALGAVNVTVGSEHASTVAFPAGISVLRGGGTAFAAAGLRLRRDCVCGGGAAFAAVLRVRRRDCAVSARCLPFLQKAVH